MITLVLATATPGGGFPLYGDVFAHAVNAQLGGEKRQLRIETRNTKGSTENVPLLEEGKVDLGLVAGELASAALAKPGTPLRIVAAIYSSPGMFVLRADSPVRRIADLKGKPVVLGTHASGITALGRTVLKSLGVEVQEITLDKAADGPALLMDGRAAALWGAGVGWPAFAALAKQGGRFMAPDAREIETILAKNPGLQAVTLPADSYPGQHEALASVGSWSYVLSGPNLPEETGYLLARAIHRAEPQLAKKLQQARETTMANLVAAAPRRELIHPGVQRYLREIGLLR
ncbi:MAG TPA: TAXI family TRAP transporter solute-binding subunit, partial [Myxococcales bacterium]|nr:TAXI family TRAP transporter solute-binding subunit [Myxococcales bacterium]